jgi:hypothetical protein
VFAYRPLRLAALLALLLAPGVAHGQARESEGDRFTVVFRGAALDEALGEIVGLTGIDLVFNTELVAERRVYCVRQHVPAEELLRCTLAGSGLDYVRSSSGAYVLIVAPRQRPPPARLAGRVVDAVSGQPLPYAHVLLADAATTADADGFFLLSGVEPGWHSLTATYVGYRVTVLDEVWVEPGSTERVVVPIEPAALALAPVVIDGLSQRLPSERLGRLEAPPAPAGALVATRDVMRGAAATMGVSSALPLADLHVQGGQSSEHVTRLDGVPVRDPVALGRFLGAFSPLALADATVHKAGFGVAHGSHLTGAVDLRHDLYGDGSRIAVQADPVSLNARLAVPVRMGQASDGRLLLAYRHSAWDLFRDAGLTELLQRSNQVDPLITSVWLRQPVRAGDVEMLAHRPEVAFSDAHAAVHLRPDLFTTVGGSLYRAGNFVATSQRALFLNGGHQQHLDFRDEYDWSNWAGQVRVSRLIGARAVASVRARGSHHASSYAYWYAAEDQYAPGEYAEAEAFAAHRLVEAGLDADVSLSVGPGRDLELGVSADVVDAHFEALNAFVPRLDVDVREVLLSGYAQGRLGIGQGLSLEGGSRLAVLPRSGRVFAEPRAGLRLDGSLAGSDGYAVRLAGGLYRQFVNGFAFRSAGPASLVPELWFWLPVAGGIDPPRAFHLTLDGLLLPAGGWTLRAETYARWEPHVLALDVPALMDRTADDAGGRLDPATVVAGARGYALGLGMGAGWDGRRVAVRASYSLEQTRRTVPSISSETPLMVPWAEPHRLSGSARVDLRGGFAVEAAGRGIWGRRWGLRDAYYDYLGGSSEGGFTVDTTQPDHERLPPLLVLDGRVTYRPAVRTARLLLEAGVANILDRDNVIDWSVDGPEDGRAVSPRLLPGRRATFAVRVAF